MKRLGLLLLVILPCVAFAQGFTPDATYWKWTYNVPDSISALTYTRKVSDDDLMGNPASSLGYTEMLFEVHQIVASDTLVDSVQFTLWGITAAGDVDSLSEFGWKYDSTWASTPLHQALIAADSVGKYVDMYWQARWDATDTISWPTLDTAVNGDALRPGLIYEVSLTAYKK